MLSKLLLALAVVPVFSNIIPRQDGGGGEQNQNQNMTEPSSTWPHLPVDLGKLNGTWDGIAVQTKVFKEMEKISKRYNVSCECPKLNLIQNSPVSLQANFTCDIQYRNYTFPVVSEGFLTWLPFPKKENNTRNDDHDKENGLQDDNDHDDWRKENHRWNTTWAPNKYYLAVLFSRPYIQSNDSMMITTNNTMPNLNQTDQQQQPQQQQQQQQQPQQQQHPKIDEYFYRGYASGDKGYYIWSIYSSSQNETLNDVAHIQTVNMTSADNLVDIPDIQYLVSKNTTMYDNSTYDRVASTIPELGQNYTRTFTKLPNTCEQQQQQQQQQ
ncbi:unnamed protein product [Cunninghamella echinulata]